MTTLTKKEINSLLHLIHSQVISINEEEIKEEIERSGDIFGFKSIQEAEDLYNKLENSIRRKQ
tara:strand:- start:376 stop:564 length:189 start_codon:yes stop_codon:yes gene_type:complete